MENGLEMTIHVFDNASADADDLEVALQLLDWNDVALVRSDQNLGFGAACNRSLFEIPPVTNGSSDDDIVFFVNPDTRSGEEAFINCVSLLSAHPNAIVGARLQDESGELDTNCWRNDPTPSRMAWYYLRVGKLVSRVGFKEYKPVTPPVGDAVVENLSGAFFGARLELLQRLGGFDERFWMYAEDLDLFRRARLLNAPVMLSGGPPAVHIGGASSASSKASRARARSAFFRSAGLYFDRYGRRWRPDYAIARVTCGYLARRWAARIA
jgi:GT2 family glycosyltransferase